VQSTTSFFLINKGGNTNYSAIHCMEMKDACTMTDQEDEGEELVKNQAELVTLKEYHDPTP